MGFPNTNNTKKPLLRMKVNSMKRKKKKWPKRNFGTLFTFLQLFVYKKSCLQFPILQSKAYYTKATFFSFISLKLDNVQKQNSFFQYFLICIMKTKHFNLFFSFSNFFHYSILRRKYIRLLILLSFLPLI